MPYLDHVNALLHQALATCKAAVQVSKPPEPLVKKENMCNMWNCITCIMLLHMLYHMHVLVWLPVCI